MRTWVFVVLAFLSLAATGPARACGLCMIEQAAAYNLVKEVAAYNPVAVIGRLEEGEDEAVGWIVVDNVLKDDLDELDLVAGARLPFSLAWRKKLQERSGINPLFRPNQARQGVWILDYADGVLTMRDIAGLQPLTPTLNVVEAIVGTPSTFEKPRPDLFER